MSDPLISVGIPFYNCEAYLLDSIRSIFAQTYAHWELLLVDDGSTDESLQIAQSIDDPRVRLLPSDGKNRKLAARLNQIARNARGEYLARMDADDLCHPLRLERQLRFLREHPEVDIVGGASCILDPQGRPAKKFVVSLTHEQIFKRKFTSGISVVHPCLFAKTEWWRRWPYDENNYRSQDYELWLRTCKDNVFANMPGIYYYTNEFVSYALHKYARSKHLGAKIVWHFARREAGLLPAAYYAARRYLHIAIYALALCLGFRNAIISRRYQPLTKQEYMEIAQILEYIRNTKLPFKTHKQFRRTNIL
jgi:glycosyltransferase involved in cell wall biosynthesis